MRTSGRLGFSTAFSAVVLGGATWACNGPTVRISLGSFEPDSTRAVWVEERARTLVGHSVTQAPMQNLSFDIEAWVETLAERGVGAAMIWSFMAVRQTSDGERFDGRYGYTVPDVGPWQRTGSRLATDGRPTWNLNRFDEEQYWPRFRMLLEATQRRGIVLWVTVFDGWTKGEVEPPIVHPFRTQNGGPLSRHEDFVELYRYGEEIQGPFQTSWPWRKQNQWFQEQFADRLAREVDPYDHVILELFNEGAWYGSERLLRHHEHFIPFLRRRTDNLLAVNEDNLSSSSHQSIRSELRYDIASWHSHEFVLERTHSRWLTGYQIDPGLPLVNSETVPAYSGTVSGPSVDQVRRLWWGVLMAGGHVFVQDDAAFSFDSAAPQRRSEELLDQLGHASRFFARPGYESGTLSPCAAPP